jgi:hypothetical protein
MPVQKEVKVIELQVDITNLDAHALLDRDFHLRLCAKALDLHVPKETQPLFFECFPYVCPEPVLVK